MPSWQVKRQQILQAQGVKRVTHYDVPLAGNGRLVGGCHWILTVCSSGP